MTIPNLCNPDGSCKPPAKHAIADMPGKRFSRLVVLSLAGRNIRRQLTWLCQCDCGTSLVVNGCTLRGGTSRSCGCLQREAAAATGERTKTHGMATTSTYTIWGNMIARCHNPKSKHYPSYGGRGIQVCQRWRESFENFLADMGKRPDGKSLDRFPDNDGNYERGNCRWATTKEQARNKRDNRILEVNGERLPLAEWSERTGLNPQTLHARLRRGWSDADAVLLEVRR